MGKLVKSILSVVLLVSLIVPATLATASTSSTALFSAIENNDVDAVKSIIANNRLLVNAREAGTLETSAHKAVKSGNEQMVQALINARANFNLQDAKGLVPLHLAVRSAGENGSAAMVNTLLNIKGLKLDARNYQLDSTGKAAKDERGSIILANSPLYEAVDLNNHAVVDSLLAKNALVNLRNEDRNTALHRAAQSKDEVMVDKLLAYKANPNMANINRSTPLHYAVMDTMMDEEQGNGIVEKLLAAKANPNIKNIYDLTPLSYILDDLYMYDANDSYEYDFNKPLFDILVAAGATVNVIDTGEDDEMLLIERAFKVDRADIVAAIASVPGAKVDLTNEDNETLLHRALFDENLEMVKAILKGRPNLSIRTTQNGDTPLHVAVHKANFIEEGDRAAYVKEILQKTPKFYINIKNDYMDTALHIAAADGYVEVAEALVAAGAHLNILNYYKETPLAVATDEAMITFLKSKGAK